MEARGSRAQKGLSERERHAPKRGERLAMSKAPAIDDWGGSLERRALGFHAATVSLGVAWTSMTSSIARRPLRRNVAKDYVQRLPLRRNVAKDYVQRFQFCFLVSEKASTRMSGMLFSGSIARACCPREGRLRLRWARTWPSWPLDRGRAVGHRAGEGASLRRRPSCPRARTWRGCS
jgi:hypothetical protein